MATSKFVDHWDLLEPIRVAAKEHTAMWDGVIDAAMGGNDVSGPGCLRVRVKSGMTVAETSGGLLLFGTTSKADTIQVEIETEIRRIDHRVLELPQGKDVAPELTKRQLEKFQSSLLKLAEQSWDVPEEGSMWDAQWIRLMRRVLKEHQWSELMEGEGLGTNPTQSRYSFVVGLSEGIN